MFLLDSNIVIYALQPEQEMLRAWLATKTLAVSAVTRVEVLGFHRITEAESKSAADLLGVLKQLAIDDAVVAEAIRLRRQRRMSLADSLIAGTAMSHGLSLATRNVDDFRWIRDLGAGAGGAEPNGGAALAAIARLLTVGRGEVR